MEAFSLAGNIHAMAFLATTVSNSYKLFCNTGHCCLCYPSFSFVTTFNSLVFNYFFRASLINHLLGPLS